MSPWTADPAGGDLMSEHLAHNWWAIALRGVVAILFGLVAMFMPGVTMLSLIFVFGAYAFVDGIFAIVAAIGSAQRTGQRYERWGMFLLEGIVGLAAGVVAFLWPTITLVAFVLLMAAWAIASGALMLAASLRLRRDHGRRWLALGGIVSIIFGVLLVIAPLIGAVVLTWWLGVYALIFGIALLVLA